MPTNRRQSEPHQRTRRDHATETAEDYVEAVAAILATQEKCRVVDLSRKFGVSHVTVTKIISRLVKAGLVTTVPYGPIELTERGQELASQARQRHEIVYRFLLALGVNEQVAASDAEGIEHHVSPETLSRMKKFARQSESSRD